MEALQRTCCCCCHRLGPAENIEKLVAGIGSEFFDDDKCFDRVSVEVQTMVEQGTDGTTEQASMMDKMTNAPTRYLSKFLTAASSNKSLELLRNTRSISLVLHWFTGQRGHCFFARALPRRGQQPN